MMRYVEAFVHLGGVVATLGVDLVRFLALLSQNEGR
jgi:hypothetical protein